MKELNEAYAVLRDTGRRRAYDASRLQSRGSNPHPKGSSANEDQPKHRSEQSTSASSAADAGSWGVCNVSDLTPDVQQRLRAMRDAKDPEALVLTRGGWIVLAAVGIGLLTIFPLYLMFSPAGPQQAQDWWLAAGAMMLAGAIAMGSLHAALNLRKCILGSCEIFTPFYFLRVNGDIIKWHLLAAFNEFAPTHHYTNWQYQNTSVAMRSPSHEVTFTLKTKDAFAKLWDQLQAWWQMNRERANANDTEYFRRHTLFPKANARDRQCDPSYRRKQAPWICVGVMIALATLGGGQLVGRVAKGRALERYAKGPAAEAHTPFTPLRSGPIRRGDSPYPASVVRSPYGDLPVAAATEVRPQPTRISAPERPLPLSGTFHNYTGFACIAPFKVVTQGHGNYFVKLCDLNGRTVVAMFVRGGDIAQVNVPLGIYQLKYAEGETWYGTPYLFGTSTRFFKADDTFDFRAADDSVSGYSVELFLQPNGNLHVDDITADEF